MAPRCRSDTAELHRAGGQQLIARSEASPAQLGSSIIRSRPWNDECPSDDIGGFAWNEAKSERRLRERGLSFAFVVPVFADPDRRVEIDDRRNYGETRYRLYGRIAGRLFVVVYTLRGRVIWITSARKANARERRRHGDQGTPEGRRDGG